MWCNRCKGKLKPEREYAPNGYLIVLVCMNCGDRSIVYDDKRIKLNKEDTEMPTGFPVSDEKKAEILKMVLENKPVKEIIKTISVSPATIRQIKEANGIPVEHRNRKSKNHSPVKHIPARDYMKEKGITVVALEQPEIKGNRVTLIFTERDSEMYKTICKNAETNRRTIENEILTILEESI